MKLFISSNNTLNAERSELVKFISQICDEYGFPPIKIVENNAFTEDKLAQIMGECDLFFALTDTDIESHIMKAFNAATVCNMRGKTPIIYVYNKEPQNDDTLTDSCKEFSKHLIDETKRLWIRFKHSDFLRINFALQLEAFNPRLFETKLIGQKIYLRNLEVGDMLNCSAVLHSFYYNNLRQYLNQTDIARHDTALSPNEKFQEDVFARKVRQKIQELLASYYEIYKRMITLPSRAASSQLRVGYNNIYNGNATESLKALNIEELTDTTSRLGTRVKNGEELNQYNTLELSGAIEAMGLRALVIMTDTYNPIYINQAIEAMQKAILFAGEGRASGITYAQHITTYALFLSKYKNDPDGSKWYELALEVLLRTTSEESMEVGKAYLNIANYYIAAENNEKAMWALKQALSIISKLSPKDPVMGLIYWGIAKVHERRGEYTEALTHCTAGEELYLMTHSVGDLMSIKFWFMQIRLRKEMSQPDFSEEEYLAKEQMILHYYGAEEPLIEFYLFFADMYADSNLYKQAADVLSKVLIMSDDKLGGLSLTSQAILYRMIFAHRYMKDNESALKVASELIQRLRLAPEQYQDMKRAADTFFVIGRIKDSLESYNDAIENFSHALTVYNSVVGKDCTESADCHKQMGDIYSKCGQSKQALEHYQNGLRIAESKYGESSVEAGIYYSLIAEEYFFDDDYPLAVEYYIKVIELDDGNGEDLSKEMLNAIRKAYIGIGSCQVFVEDYEAAKSTYDFLFDRFGHANNLEYSDIYLKYAMTLKGCGQDQEALTHYFKAINLKIIFHGGDNKYLAPIYVKVAQIYEEHNMRDEALEYYTNGVNIFIKFVCRDHEYVMSNYYQIARLQLINEKYQEAFDAAMQAKEIYDNLGLDSTEEYATIYGYLYEAAIKLGRTEEALKYKKI